MSNTVLHVNNLSKQYEIASIRYRHDTLRDQIMEGLKSIFRSDGRFRGNNDKFWALKDFSFDVRAGETIGLIGRNGAGKSTLLKILSRITVPTSGRVEIYGRVGSLLEVGTGFDRELTGRENIFLSGAILGMKRVEIKSRFDEIVAFAEVEKFIDTPIKRYSSGMHTRLGFAVAAHLEPEILLVDEVLAVGDATFQKKCLGKMGEVAGQGRTVLYVSHNLESVRTLCRRAIWLHDGAKQADGDATDVIERYLASLRGNDFYFQNTDFGFVIQRIALKNSRCEETSQFYPGEDLFVEISFHAKRPVEKPYIIIIVQGINGNCFTANMLLDGHRPAVLEGTGSVTCKFKNIPLLPQSYTVRMVIRAKDGKESIIDYTDIASFSVIGNLEDYGYKGEFITFASVSTPVVVPYEWLMPDGTIASVALRKT